MDTDGRMGERGGGIGLDSSDRIDLGGLCLIDIHANGESEMDVGGMGDFVNMVPVMTVSKGDKTIESLSLMDQDIFVMGRCSCSADLLVGHATCSRKHLEIQIIHGTREVVLTDLGSGTFTLQHATFFCKMNFSEFLHISGVGCFKFPHLFMNFSSKLGSTTNYVKLLDKVNNKMHCQSVSLNGSVFIFEIEMIISFQIKV
jgi:hypothetical protein